MSKKVEVSVDFVIQAHKAACQNWKQKIEKEFPSLFEEKYRAGSRIRITTKYDDSEYLLIHMGTKAYLNNMDNGNVWSSEAMDYRDGYITKNQLDKYIKGSTAYEKTWQLISKNI